MRILIAGGRDFNDAKVMQYTLSGISSTSTEVVISGGANGADKLGEEWARGRSIPVERYPALWKEHGRAAGPIRNQQMLDEGKPDLVVVFPGGEGSQSMVRKARKAGVTTLTPRWTVL